MYIAYDLIHWALTFKNISVLTFKTSTLRGKVKASLSLKYYFVCSFILNNSISQIVVEKIVQLLCTIIPLKRLWLHAVTESLNPLSQFVMGWCSPLAPSSFDAGKVTRLFSASSLMDFAALYRLEYTSVLFLPYQKSFPTRKRLSLCLSLSLLLYCPFFSGVATVMNGSYNLMILIK